MNKIIYFLIFFLIQSCGYQPIYSSKNILIKIDKINYPYSKINNQIARSLRNISNEESNKIIDVNFKSKREKITVSKTKSGDPEMFELIISVDIEIFDNQKTFTSKQNYKNIENKFELNQHEFEIEKQLLNEIVNKILIHLTNFK